MHNCLKIHNYHFIPRSVYLISTKIYFIKRWTDLRNFKSLWTIFCRLGGFCVVKTTSRISITSRHTKRSFQRKHLRVKLSSLQMYYRDRIKYWARLRWRKFSPQQLGAVSEKNRTQIDRLESQKIPLNQPTTPIAILIKRLISHQIGCLLTIRTQIYKKCTKSLTKSKCLFAKF